MGTINRFMQPINPVIINPISIEQFAMVPLAKAEAKAAGIQALSTYTLPYNVDQKDLPYIKQLGDHIDTKKSDMITRIINEGITDNLVSDFIDLKGQYKMAKKDVAIAENNKALIDQWKKEVLQLHQNDPAYVERILNREYGQGWQGTFNPDGTSNVFEKTRAPKSFDIFEDFNQGLAGVPMEEIKELRQNPGSYSKLEQKADGTMGVFIYSSSGKRVFTNRSKLETKLDAMLLDYSNPNSMRGAYAKYDEVPGDYILGIANRVLESKVQTEEELNKTSKDYGYDYKAPEASNFETYETDNALDTNQVEDSESKASIYTKGFFNLGLTTLKHIFSGFTKGPTRAAVDYVTEMSKIAADTHDLVNKTAENKAYYGKYVYDVLSTAVNENDGSVVKYSPKEQEFINEYKKFLLDNPEYVKKDQTLTQEGYDEFFDKYKDYVEDYDFQNLASQVKMWKDPVYVNKELGLKNDVPGKSSDLAGNLRPMNNKEGSNRLVMDVGTKTLVSDQDMIDNLALGLENMGGQESKGKYYVTPVGVPVNDPDFYRTHSGGKTQFQTALPFGSTYTLYHIDDDGKRVTDGTFLIGNSKEKQNDPNYISLVGKLKKVSDIPVGGVKIGTYKGRPAVIKRNFISEGVNTDVMGNDSYGQIRPGAVSIEYVDEKGIGRRKEYGYQDLNNLDIN